MGHGVRGKAPVPTERRHVGLGPAEVRVADVVFMLYGWRFLSFCGQK